MAATPAAPPSKRTTARLVERVQTGVRLERRLLKVLKGLAEDLDLTLGDLLEGVLLHAFEGKAAFSPRTRQRIAELSRFYGLTLTAEDSHRLRERGAVAQDDARHD
jgi:predicted DNA-binding ribbon-helix-helix protein